MEVRGVGWRFNKGTDSYALAGLIGALLGWASGMYFAPHGHGEQNKFVTMAQAVSAFASGYLMSKIDRFV